MRTLLVLLLAVTATAAFAYDKVVRATMTKVNLDPSVKFEGTLGHVQLTVDEPNGLATLEFWTDTCPIGANCLVGPLNHKKEFPIVSKQTEGCGTDVIVAENDSRRFNGRLERLTIRDNTHFICESFAAMAPTEVVYEVQSNHPAVNAVSTMTGPALK